MFERLDQYGAESSRSNVPKYILCPREPDTDADRIGGYCSVRKRRLTSRFGLRFTFSVSAYLAEC